MSHCTQHFLLCKVLQGRMSGQAKSNELQYTAIPNSNENRDPVMRTGIPCNENRYFPVGIDSQGVPCEPYRVWVCSVCNCMCVKVF